MRGATMSRTHFIAALLAMGVAVGTLAPLSRPDVAVAAESAVRLPPPALDPPSTAPSETAILAGGCFGGVQGVFQRVKGVTSAVSGYAGGSKTTAHYRRVGEGDTGHAEAVRITYDPRQISYGRLLQIFFSVVHD